MHLCLKKSTISKFDIMKKPFYLKLPKALYVLFLIGTVVGTALFLLQLSDRLGISGEHYYIRGWVNVFSPSDKMPFVELPSQEIGSSLKVFESSLKKEFVLIKFTSLSERVKVPYIWYTIAESMSWLAGLLILYQMMLLFKNIDRGSIFSPPSIRRVRFLALLVFCFPLLRFISAFALTNIVRKIQDTAEMRFFSSMRLDDILVGAISALIIYALVEIFRRGQTLQHEQDLTI